MSHLVLYERRKEKHRGNIKEITEVPIKTDWRILFPSTVQWKRPNKFEESSMNLLKSLRDKKCKILSGSFKGSYGVLGGRLVTGETKGQVKWNFCSSWGGNKVTITTHPFYIFSLVGDSRDKME